MTLRLSELPRRIPENISAVDRTNLGPSPVLEGSIMFGKSKQSTDAPQVAPPGAAAPSGFSGPVIPGTGARAEQVPTLASNAKEMMDRAPPGRCIKPGCSGQLSVFRGVVMVEGGNGTKLLEASERCRRPRDRPN